MEEILKLKAEAFDLIKQAEGHQMVIRELQARLSEIAAKVEALESGGQSDDLFDEEQ